MNGKVPVRIVGAGAILAVLAAAACAVNPVTGKHELSLIPESQEIALGRDSDAEIVATMGLVQDEAVQTYVAGLGRKLAAASERPGLPWTFRVVDDPVVNAFALPGGFVYVTRGLMTHLSSEAELVAVLGHEIGHVTAKHGVSQMSKAQIAQIGLGVGASLGGTFESLAGLVSEGVGLLFLKFGRDDERQADDVGLRYMVRAGYDPRPMTHVFDTLARVSASQGGGRIPTWMSTHPAPEDRRVRTERAIAALGTLPANASVGRDPYLDRLDGMTFGTNPRHGYFQGDAFYHPDMAFRIDFPAGWKKENRSDAVVAAAPEGDAIIRLALAKGASPQAAADTFFGQQGVQAGNAWQGLSQDIPSVGREFRATSGSTQIDGIARFAALDSRVFQVVGYATPEGWKAKGPVIRTALQSFKRVTDPKILAVRPWTMQIETLAQATTLETFAAKYPGPVPVATLALVNGVEPSATLAAGTRVKRIVGEALP